MTKFCFDIWRQHATISYTMIWYRRWSPVICHSDWIIFTKHLATDQYAQLHVGFDRLDIYKISWSCIISAISLLSLGYGAHIERHIMTEHTQRQRSLMDRDGIWKWWWHCKSGQVRVSGDDIGLCYNDVTWTLLQLRSSTVLLTVCSLASDGFSLHRACNAENVLCHTSLWCKCGWSVWAVCLIITFACNIWSIWFHYRHSHQGYWGT